LGLQDEAELVEKLLTLAVLAHGAKIASDVRSHSASIGLKDAPLATTTFIGRGKELARIMELLTNTTCRLLTLVGPGGIGKTRLATEVSAMLLAQGSADIYFVSLQPLPSPDLILATLANAVGLALYATSDPRQQLLDYLRSKALVLILD